MKDKIWGEKDMAEKEKKAAEPDRKEPAFIETVENRIYFYSEVDRDRILKLNKEVRSLGINLARAAANESREPSNIFIHINSYGGSLFSGLSGMDEIIKSIVPVYTVVDGCCASSATFLSVVGRRRFIQRHAYMLIHQLWSFFWGKYEEFKDEKQNLDKLMAMIKAIYKEYTRVPESKIDLILKHDLWFDAVQCKRYGMVDEIL